MAQRRVFSARRRGSFHISGEGIASASAILLFVLTFFHWFGVKAVNTSNLLFAIRAGGPGQSAWEALGFIPIFLMVTIGATLAWAAMRFAKTTRPSASVSAVVAILGIVSALSILFRIVDPPVFYSEPTITYEGAIRLPIFLALLAAIGVALGGCRAAWEDALN